MKATKFISILLVALFFCNSCKDKEISLGVQTLVGKIIVDANPCPPSRLPCVPGVVFWLETTSKNYVIKTINSGGFWSHEKIIINDIEYFEGDEVEVTGEVKLYKGYYSIEIASIKKLP